MITDVHKTGSESIDYELFEHMRTAKIGEMDTKEELTKAFHIIDQDKHLKWVIQSSDVISLGEHPQWKTINAFMVTSVRGLTLLAKILVPLQVTLWACLLALIRVNLDAYSKIRMVLGYGECFYLSFIISYLEQVLDRQDTREVHRLLDTVKRVSTQHTNLGWTSEFCGSYKEMHNFLTVVDAITVLHIHVVGINSNLKFTVKLTTQF